MKNSSIIGVLPDWVTGKGVDQFRRQQRSVVFFTVLDLQDRSSDLASCVSNGLPRPSFRGIWILKSLSTYSWVLVVLRSLMSGLHILDPELAHRLTILMLSNRLVKRYCRLSYLLINSYLSRCCRSGPDPDPEGKNRLKKEKKLSIKRNKT